MLGVVHAGPDRGAARWRAAALVSAVAIAVSAASALGVTALDGSADAATGGSRALSALAGLSGSPDGSAVSDADLAAVRTVLADHGTAMVARDRDGYAAGLDNAGGSAQFRAAELAAFGHAAAVPFASYELNFDRLAPDPVAVPAAAGRLAGRVVIVRAEVTYAFRDVDAAPATHPVYLTLVERPTGWKIAADDDLADTGGGSWRGPWYFGPLVVVKSEHGLVLGHPADDSTPAIAATRQQLQVLATDLDSAVGVVNAVWGTAWPQRVAIEVVSSSAELDSLAGEPLPFTSVTALAVAEPVATATAGPDVAAGQRILVNGPALPSLSAAGRSVLLTHELTHVATRGVTSSTMPTWVIEGFADFVGNSAAEQPVRTVAAELAAAIAAGGVPTALPADTAFVPGSESVSGTGNGSGAAGGGTTGSGIGSTAAQAYEQAWFAMRTIAQLAGPAEPAVFYRAVADANGRGIEAAAAVDEALRAVVGLDTAGFTARWQALMRTDLT